MPEITYPNEIPWKLLATSRDMMDTDISDREFPEKWKSSMAFFCFEPEFDPEVLSDRKIVYLKVVCSVTGYQVDGNELGVDVERPNEWDSRVYENFHDLIRDYYPCYGALLHLAVFPKGDNELTHFPHIIDFEPKKREMFEVVTETGEVMSRSLHALKVNTGGTNTTSMETIDVDKGWSFGTDFKYKDTGGGIKLGSEYELGSKAMSQGQNVNLRQIDASQEAKETVSHTTQLQQMYHLLDSYHLGTNRALFVITPRPHIVDQELSVTNGPRRLEGIQEFFLVVAMPADSTGLCVVGQLETSHLHKQTRTETTGTVEYETGEFTQRINEKVINGLWEWLRHIKKRYPIPVPGGYIIDRSRGNGGYDETRIERNDIDSHQVFVYDDRIDVEVTYGPDVPGDDAKFTYDYTVYYKSTEPVSEPVRSTVAEIDLFMTGRYLEGCLDFSEFNYPSAFVPPENFRIHSEYVVMEERLPRRFIEIFKDMPKIGMEPDKASSVRQKLNELQFFVRDRSLASINNPNRYAYGQHSIIDTDFALRTMRLIREVNRYKQDDYITPIHVTDEIIKKIDDEEKVKSLKQLSRADIAKSNVFTLSRWMGLTVRDVIELKKSNIGIPTLKARMQKK